MSALSEPAPETTTKDVPMDPEVRKIVTIVEEIHREGHAALSQPVRAAAACAVIKNPFADAFVEDISVLPGDFSATLGPKLAQIAADALGTQVRLFGKAALVGLSGEIEHGSQVIHTRLFGDPLRELAGEGIAPVPSAEKRGSAGASLDVPLRNAYENGTLADLDTTVLFSFEVRIPDAPAPDELIVIAAVADGGRPNPRKSGGS